MAKEIAGPVRDWLAARRDELNGRYRLAQRRFPRLDGAHVLELVAEILPPLALKDGQAGGDLMLAVYDLILLHAGRGYLGDRKTLANGSDSFAGALLRRTFPKLLPLLAKKPRALTGALSNAAENLGERGVDFAEQIGEIGRNLQEPDLLLDAGVVLAWRLGEPRLRNDAFIAGAKLPPRAALLALGQPDWPDAAAVLAFTALQADAWRHPQRLFAPETLARLAKSSPKDVEPLRRKLAEPPAKNPSAWQEAATAGNFSGFGGHFDEPPLLLGNSMLGNRHRFWVFSTEGIFRIDADAFGWVCSPDVGIDLPVQEVKPRPSKLGALLKGKTNSPQLYPDGRLESVGYGADLPNASGAATFACGPGLVVYTHPESFRVRVLTPARDPL